MDCHETNCSAWPRFAQRLWNRACSERGVSWRATYGIGTKPRKSPQSDTPDGLDRSRAGLWPAARGAGNDRPSRLASDHYFEAEL
jgi:hypothetical protein